MPQKSGGWSCEQKGTDDRHQHRGKNIPRGGTMNRIDRRAPHHIIRTHTRIRPYGPRNRTSGKRAWQLSIPQSLRRYLEAHGWEEGDRIQMDYNVDTGALTLKKKEKKPEKKGPATFDHEGVE